MKKQITDRCLAMPIVTVLTALLLLAEVGCINISIRVTESPTSSQGPSPDDSSGDGAGNFVPVQALPVGAGTGASVCGHPVTVKVLFTLTDQNETLPTQTPPPGTKGFLGTVIDLDNNNAPIANTDYYLQVFVNGTMRKCCANVGATQVSTNVWAGYPTALTAFFKGNHEPPANHRIQLQGAWTQ